MAACTEKVKSGRFIYFFAGRMGGFPAVQACEGTPLGEARRGVGVAVSLLAGHAVGVDASVLLYKLVVGNMPMLRSCRERRYAPVAKALANRMLRLVEHGVTPIVVFDGQARYPAKGGEHAERAGRRAAAEARIAAGSVSAAEEQPRRSRQRGTSCSRPWRRFTRSACARLSRRWRRTRSSPSSTASASRATPCRPTTTSSCTAAAASSSNGTG